MEPATIAALAQGAGSLLSGLGFGKSKSSAPGLQEQSAAALGHERDSFNQKMALAKQHGIHPLSVLGVPSTTFSPAIVAASGNDTDYSAIGSGIERIAQSQVKPPEAKPNEPDPAQVRMQDAQLRTAEANAKRSEWEALAAEWRASDLLRGQPGNPPALRTSNDSASLQQLAAAQAGVKPSLFTGGKVDLKQDILPPHPSLLGHGLGADQSFIRGVDQHGKFYSVLNPNLIQADFEDGATITALSKIYGPERAIEIAAVLEQAGPIAGGLGAVGAAGKLAYDYFSKQRADALAKRRYQPNWNSRGRGARGGSRNE